MIEMMGEKEKEVNHLRGEQTVFLKENLKILEKLDKIDWTLVRKAETMTTETLSEFKVMIDAF
jgi:hypothetical protein